MSTTALDREQAIREWAAAMAAQLDPLSDEDARAVGRIARELDAKRAAARQP